MLIASLGASSSSLALDESRLWLPGSYVTHYLKLKEAALLVEELERCKVVLRGTIDLEQSSEDRPIYRILCRQENNKTYNEMVDGSTMETLTTRVVVEDKLSAEELEQKRLEEEKRLAEELKLQKLNAWSQCAEVLNKKVALMDAVEWIGDYPPEPDEFADGNGLFTVNFNAKDVYQQALKYRATCRTLNEDVQLRIKKRVDPEIPPSKAP
ncbi:hypothetical protein TDB9533_01667 [Thalassocella blandensis]|nr:hypothetical protein TDB9533_01667 [Thalassocella blandensis]